MNADYSEALEKQLYLLRQVRDLRAAGHSLYLSDVYDDSEFVPTILTVATTFFWGKEQCELLESAAATLPVWRLDAGQFEADCGFAWFSAPLRVVRPGRLSHAARHFFDSDLTQGIGISALMWALTPERDGVLVVTWQFDGSRDVIPDTKILWKFSDPIPSLADSIDLVMTPDGMISDVLHSWNILVLASACAFMQQRILTAPTMHLERHARKRVERSGWTAEPIVRVVQLRRHESVQHDTAVSQGVDWAWQWLVRGHWRQQACGSKRGDRQPRWISPYVKGPDDKPLKQPRATVFAVVR